MGEQDHPEGEPRAARRGRRRARDEARAGIAFVDVVRNGALVLVVLAMVWLAFNVRLPSLDRLQAIIDGYGWWGWAAFIGLYTIVAVTPIPVTIMAMLGGVLFGVWEGTLLSLVGVTLGSLLAYGIARGLGRNPVLKLLGSHADTVAERLTDGGVWAVSLLRLTPGIPYWPVNYGAGAFGVSLRDFAVATVLCSAPGQLSLVAIGAFVSDPGRLNGTVVVVSWVVVLVLTFLVLRTVRSRRRGRTSS